MKNHLFWLIFIGAGIALISVLPKPVHAQINVRHARIAQSIAGVQAAPTKVSTLSPTEEVNETPEKRELPPVGRNAGLVIGASVLVLIIISGVLGTRRRSKH